MPFADLPVAPAGEQNAPGDTIDIGEGDGVGDGVGIGAEAAISNTSDFLPLSDPNALTSKEILNVSSGASRQEMRSSDLDV